ncbi:MAG: sensor histidine kinase [Bacteroidia bacterium]|nr:sensor histidine kinase [Bacteroidia bacterium]
MITEISNSIRRIPSWVNWVGLAIIGLLIIILNDAFGEEDSFVVFSLFYFAFLTFSIARWIFSQIRTVIELKRDKVNMEMLHLKSQVNPHFFFNTLNNLYGLVEIDPKKAQELILKLSDMMRYSIYEGQNEWVSLEQEVAYLKNYVELHRDRYHKTVKVDFQSTIAEKGYKIMPLLLILLVENAFKHGVEKLRNEAFIKMELVAENNRIDFKITNNYEQEEENNLPAGIGISNLKRRLDIGYNKDYKLSIAEKEETFHAHLSLHKV